MKHITKKIISILFVMCFIFLFFIHSFAENSKMNLSEVSANIDEIIKININIADIDFSKAELKLEYNTTELSFEGFESGYISSLFAKTESGEYSNGNLYFKITNETDILSSGTLCSAKFKILKDNNRSPVRANLTAYKQNGFRASVPSTIAYVNSGTFKTNQSPATLNDLNVYAIYKNNSKKELALTPKFSQNNYSYTCSADSDVSDIVFSAYSKEGKISINGNSQLSNGENIFKINIDGNNNNRITYSIIINKDVKNNLDTDTNKFINTEQSTIKSGVISSETKPEYIINNNDAVKNTTSYNAVKEINENKSIKKTNNTQRKKKTILAVISLILSLAALSGFVYFYYLDFIKINKHKKDKNNEKDSF